ncbi:BatD family protein [Bacteroides bouchesdurhonensis]|uniref:BatD family protein n=1 Tax=Bacteroides bouchesdurhonensis TaxID=1841855 RepID=UPI00097F8616|nr:BatD family protein [Bacteroides bouchesdurhonensis]
MNRNYILIALLCLLCISRAAAQSVTVEAKIDSLQIWIGEQAKLQLQVAMDAKQRAIFPAYTDTIVPGIEIVETAKPDTQFLNDRQRMLITQEYTITSFDSALYYIPPVPVTVDGKVYKSKALALKVYSMPVDTLHPDQFFGQKTVMKAPFAWEDWYGLIACSFLALPLLGLLIYLIIRIRDNKPIIRKIKVEPKLPPHQAALQEIERIKNEKVWQKGQPKEYYTELTDIIRTYIRDRFGFNALEMTSSEIIDKLLEIKDKEAISDLKFLFQTADLVKFAKHAPQINENDMNLINAVDFINETKQPEEENQKPQPTEITIIEKRSLRTKVLLICGIVLLSAALMGTFVYIGLQLYELFA